MNKLIDRIKHCTETYLSDTLTIRRLLHQHPELSFNEFKTSAFIASKLTELGIDLKKDIAQTGIIGIIRGEKPSTRVIALRADMDALPINEETGVDYQSLNPGVMHACGHDLHTACLLGTARILQELKSEFGGTVLLIFQPGEEKLPGGAKLILEDELFEQYKPQLVIGQHVLPTLEAGKVGFRNGKYMASCDEIYLTVEGQGGHGAMPFQLNDTVLIASHIIVALQQIVSRNANSFTPTVLSFGKVVADGATNIIPDKVYLEGTFRTMDEQWRQQAHEKITRIATSIAQSMGASCKVNIMKGYPSVYNQPGMTTKASDAARQLLGKEAVVETEMRMTADDFAYFSQKYPSVYYRLGVGYPGGKNAPLHSSLFSLNEDAVKTGVETMAWLTCAFLNQGKD